MANSEYNLTVVDGTALTISLSGPVGPAGAGGGSSTISTSTLTNLTGYIYGNGTTIAGATAATSANTANTLVKRDATGGTSFFGDVTVNGDQSTSPRLVLGNVQTADETLECTGQIVFKGSDQNRVDTHVSGGESSIYLASFYGGISVSGTTTITAPPLTGTSALLSFYPITGDKTYTFPNASGTVPVYTGNAAVGKVLTSTGTTGVATWQDAATGSGSVTSVSVTTANGVSGNVATSTTTPAITLTLGAITPTSVNGNTITTGTGTLTLSNYTLTVTGTASVSGTNTGDQTNITGNAATVTTNANLTGHVTSTGSNTTSLGSFTIAQLNTAVSDADVAKVDAQTHTGAHVFTSTTRPTSSGSGTPADISLVTRTDVDRRYLSALRSINMDLWSLWSSTVTTGGSTSANVGYLGINGANGTTAGAALAKFDGGRNFCGVAPTGNFSGIDFANKVNCNFAFVTRSWADFTSLNWAFIFGECEAATFTGIADRIKTGTGATIGWVGLRCVAGSVTIVAVNGTSTVRESAQIDTCLNSTVNTKGYRMEISGGIITVFNSLGIVLGTLGTGASDGAPTTPKPFTPQAMVQSSVTTSQIGIIIQHISFDW